MRLRGAPGGSSCGGEDPCGRRHPQAAQPLSPHAQSFRSPPWMLGGSAQLSTWKQRPHRGPQRWGFDKTQLTQDPRVSAAACFGRRSGTHGWVLGTPLASQSLSCPRALPAQRWSLLRVGLASGETCLAGGGGVPLFSKSRHRMFAAEESRVVCTNG